jgi:hypothetical protein
MAQRRKGTTAQRKKGTKAQRRNGSKEEWLNGKPESLTSSIFFAIALLRHCPIAPLIIKRVILKVQLISGGPPDL